MWILLLVLHSVVCIALILIVLFQTGKGADMGAAFGGGSSQTLFGSTGASTFLSKATTIVAILFMLTSLSLAFKTTHRPDSSIIDDNPDLTQKQIEEKKIAESVDPGKSVQPKKAEQEK